MRHSAPRAWHQERYSQIFIKAQNKIQDPAKLFRLIDMAQTPKNG